MTNTRLLRRTLPPLLALILLPWAVAQQTKPPGGGGAGNTGGSRGDTNKPPVVQPPTDVPRMPRQNPQMLFISGMVVQEDGTPLPSGVVIERICGGRVKKEAYATSSGSFGFQIGGISRFNGILPEASDDSFGSMDGFGRQSSQQGTMGAPADPLSSGNLMGCDLRAQLAGYRSNTIILGGLTLSGNVDVGTILMQPISKVQGTMVSLNDMRAPKEARKAKERAAKAVQKGNLNQAEKDLKAALDAYPDYASAWYQLGLVYQKQKRNQDARDAYKRAIQADSKYVGPYIQLAGLAGMEQKWEEVAEITDRALALDPLDYPEGYYFNSVAYYVLNKLDVAERSARKAQRLDPLHRIPKINLILADILQLKQDLTGSKEQLRAYVNFSPTPPDADKVRARIQKLEEMSKSVASTGPQTPE